MKNLVLTLSFIFGLLGHFAHAQIPAPGPGGVPAPHVNVNPEDCQRKLEKCREGKAEGTPEMVQCFTDHDKCMKGESTTSIPSCIWQIILMLFWSLLIVVIIVAAVVLIKKIIESKINIFFKILLILLVIIVAVIVILFIWEYFWVPTFSEVKACV